LKLRKIEEELTQIETNPQNADHFDRLVLSNPNSSFIWIKYMAYHLQVKIKLNKIPISYRFFYDPSDFFNKPMYF
jgi:hypothetical protein